MEIQHKGNLWETDNTDLILRRKKALIYRDPLTHEYLDKLRQYDRYESQNLQEANSIKDQLEKKWNVSIIPTFALSERNNINFQNVPIGLSVTVQEPLLFINRSRYEPFFSPRQHPVEYWIGIKPNQAVIVFNLDVINRNDDRKQLKKAVDKILQQKLADVPEQRTETITGEPKELAFLHKTGKRTRNVFANYLRWYDIHTREKLSFRLIAFLETIRKENAPAAYERWLDKLRTVKWKVGKDRAEKLSNSEDRIEKGVKLIWWAIHRKPYKPKREAPVIEEWNCPVHGKKYDLSCKYCKNLYDAFEHAYSMKKGYVPTTTDLSIPEDFIDTIPYIHSGRIARKPKNRNKDDSQG